MDEAERLIVQRGIAALIDHPSVYMGGPSQRALKLANEIIVTLEAAGRLRSAQCGHAGWKDYKSHGTHCPTCGLQVQKIRRTDWRPFTKVIDWSDGGPAIARWPDGTTREFDVIVQENSEGEMEVDFDDDDGSPAMLSGAVEWRHLED